jgi:hypothetical protein
MKNQTVCGVSLYQVLNTLYHLTRSNIPEDVLVAECFVLQETKHFVS